VSGKRAAQSEIQNKVVCYCGISLFAPIFLSVAVNTARFNGIGKVIDFPKRVK